MQEQAEIPIVVPDSAAAAARLLGAATEARRSVIIRGGGTKTTWGRAGVADMVLSTQGLSRIIAHEHADLTANVESGVTLAALNERLATRGQWLPVESAFDATTIGGMLAANDAGPLRHRYGTPRDLLIGMTLATTDGRLVKSGGNVVKNVAGYDLGKLVTGSLGSLAVIVSATFKLLPLPAAFGTQRFLFADRTAAAAAAALLAASQLEPIALDVRYHAPLSDQAVELLVRFGSTPAAVEAHMARAEHLLAALRPTGAQRVVGQLDAALWRRHVRRPWEGTGTVARVSWLPAALAPVLGVLDDIRRRGVRVEFVGRSAVGAGILTLEADTPTVAGVLRTLRERFDVFGQLSVLRGDAAVKSSIEALGSTGTVGPLLAAIKHAFDPADTLNRGGGA